MKTLQKLSAVAQIKWISIGKNMILMSGPLLIIALVLGFRFIYGQNTDGTLSPVLITLLLNLGISMNICLDGFLMVGTSIAEEKEKHTLRVLMTSSITGMEYFLGSILFPFFATAAVNFIVLYISGIPLDLVPMPVFIPVSLICTLISCVIGMIVGICAKNQMNANLIAYPLMMIFMMIPILGNMSDPLHKLSQFLFTGVISQMLENFASDTPYIISPLDIAVLAGELLISILIFLILYRKNGFEKD